MKKTLHILMLLFLVFVDSCKKQTDEVDTNINPGSSFASYSINIPNLPVALLIQNESATESIIVSAKRNTDGVFKEVTSILIYNTTIGIATNIKLGKDYLINEIEAVSGMDKRIASFSNYNLTNGTVNIKVIDKKTNELIVEDQEIKLTPEIVSKLLQLRTLHERDSRLRLAAGSCTEWDVAGLISSIAGCISGIVVTSRKLAVCSSITALANPIALVVALWCFNNAGRNAALTSISCELALHEIQEKYGPCKEEGEKKLEKLKCVIDNWQNIYSLDDIKKQYDECPNEPKPEPNGRSTGDPHLRTSDNLLYDFQGHGEFIAAKSTEDNFEVQVRQEDVNNTGTATLNTAIAVQTGSDVVTITTNPDQLFVNVDSQALTFTRLSLKDGAYIVRTKDQDLNTVDIYTKNGDVVRVRFHNSYLLDYILYLKENRKGKMIGLMGNYDGIPSNDLKLRNGNAVSNTFKGLYTDFDDSWRVKDQSLFHYSIGKNTDSYTKLDFPKTKTSLTLEAMQRAETVCRNAGITTEPFLSNCIYDIAVTNDNAIASSSLWGQSFDSRSTSANIPLTPVITMFINDKNFQATYEVDENNLIIRLTGQLTTSDLYFDINQSKKVEVGQDIGYRIGFDSRGIPFIWRALVTGNFGIGVNNLLPTKSTISGSSRNCVMYIPIIELDSTGNKKQVSMFVDDLQIDPKIVVNSYPVYNGGDMFTNTYTLNIR